MTSAIRAYMGMYCERATKLYFLWINHRTSFGHYSLNYLSHSDYNHVDVFQSWTFVYLAYVLGERRWPIRMHWDLEKGAHHRKRHIDKLNAPQKCDLTSLKWTLKRNKTENLTYRSIAQILHFAHQMNAFAHQSGDIRWDSCIKIWSGAWCWKFL